MFHLGLILGIVAGLVVYNDARNRGHDKTGAALWGLGALVSSLGTVLLIGYLALYYFVGRTPRPPRRPEERVIDIEAEPLGEVKNCPHCGGEIRDDFKLCPYCGRPLPPRDDGAGGRPEEKP